MAKTKLYTFYMSYYGNMRSKWHHWQLNGCRPGTCGVRKVRDLDKSATQFCQGRLIYSCQVSRVCVASVCLSRLTSAINQWHDRAKRM